MKQFRSGLVFQAHRLLAALNSRLESDKEEEEEEEESTPKITSLKVDVHPLNAPAVSVQLPWHVLRGAVEKNVSRC